MTDISGSESGRSAATEWSRLRRVVMLFVTASAIVWLCLYGAYSPFPFTQNGADVISARKVDFLTTQPIFSARAKVRVLAFGNSMVLAGFEPAVFGSAISPEAESFNAAQPANSSFIGLLKRVLARGTWPTHVLEQVTPLNEVDES